MSADISTVSERSWLAIHGDVLVAAAKAMLCLLLCASVGNTRCGKSVAAAEADLAFMHLHTQCVCTLNAFSISRTLIMS